MHSLTLLLLLVLGTSDEATPKAAAHMSEGPLGVGVALEFVLSFEGADSTPPWWGDPADIGTVRPILQVETPVGVRLLGSPPETLRTPLDFETARLGYPHGRKLHAPETPVAFELSEAPLAGATLGLNVTFWLGNDDPDRARFVRQRLELPLEAGAVSVPGNARRTTWGPGGTLAVGDRPDFELPTHDGVSLPLASYRGTPLFLATYRAHW